MSLETIQMPSNDSLVSVLVNGHKKRMIVGPYKNFWAKLGEKIVKISNFFAKNHLQIFLRDDLSQNLLSIYQKNNQKKELYYFEHLTVHPFFRTELASFTIFVIMSQAMTSSVMTSSVDPDSGRKLSVQSLTSNPSPIQSDADRKPV